MFSKTSSPKMKWFQKFHQFHPRLAGLFVWLEVPRTAAKAAAAAFTILGLPGSASGMSSAANGARIDKNKSVQINIYLPDYFGLQDKNENVVLKIMNNESLYNLDQNGCFEEVRAPNDKQ